MEVDQPAPAAGRMPPLPTEVLAVIFNNFDIPERRTFRLVSRLFRDAADYILSDELVVAKGVYSSHRWYNTSEYADQACFVRQLDVMYLNNRVLIPILKRLRRFKSNQTFTVPELIALLQHPLELKHLELCKLEFEGRSKSIHVPHLEVLVIQVVRHEDRSHSVIPLEKIDTLQFISKRLHTVCFGECFVRAAVLII